jgi:hypothetical protein
MATGSYQGKCIEDPEIRSLFTRESVLTSDWYRERLSVCQAREVALWRRHIAALEAFARTGFSSPEVNVESRLSDARRQLANRSTAAYLKELEGTIGADPFHGQVPGGNGVKPNLTRA